MLRLFAFSNLVFSNVPFRNRVQVQKCPSSYDTKDKFVTDGLEKETLPCLLKTSGKRKPHMMLRYATLYKPEGHSFADKLYLYMPRFPFGVYFNVSLT